VVFEPVHEAATASEHAPHTEHTGTDADTARIAELEQELKNTRDSHQATVEKLEATNEELRSANEEMQSSNEELQSTNEELESSKEELQSLNEELSTVNAELQNKIEELAAANDDMRNLLNSTEVASVFIDNELCIRRYADRATEIINLIETDIGRPLNDVSNKIEEPDLSSRVASVLRNLTPVEEEVRTSEDRWYSMRILPYRTTDNRIDGAVLTFSDIQKQKEAQQRLEELNAQREPTLELAQRVLDLIEEPLAVLDHEAHISLANDAFCRLAGLARDTAVGSRFSELPWELRDGEELSERLQHATEHGHGFEELEVDIAGSDGSQGYLVGGSVVPRQEGLPYRIMLRFRRKDHE
jgi:two-component system CheB/CheR fusion protein